MSRREPGGGAGERRDALCTGCRVLDGDSFIRELSPLERERLAELIGIERRARMNLTADALARAAHVKGEPPTASVARCVMFAEGEPRPGPCLGAGLDICKRCVHYDQGKNR